MLFGKLLPREGNFFVLFDRHAEEIVRAAHAFSAMVKNYPDIAAREHHAREVDDAEHAADRTTTEVMHLLHKTFITPFDREQIHALTNAMDDVADLLQDTSETMSLYDVHTITPEIMGLTDLSVKCCERMQRAVHLIGTLGKESTAGAVMQTCKEIDQLEADADRAQRAAMSALFRQEPAPDAREIIKLKAIYEQLETVTDRCEDVADIIEGIVLENS